MEKTSFQEMVESALRLMKEEGASTKQLKEYRQTGFGSIQRHFRTIGQSCYAAGIIDSFVLQTRMAWERGDVSDWKWYLVRRGGELLKHFHEHGELELPPCAKWGVVHNRLRIKPSAKEFADKDNIYALVWNTKEELGHTDYSSRTLEHYQREGFDRILRYCTANKRIDYSSELINEIIGQAERDCRGQKTAVRELRTLRRTAHLLQEFYETGTLNSCHVGRFVVRDNIDGLDDLNIRELMELALQKMKNGGIKPKLLKKYRETGFGGIVRYFEEISQPQYSAEKIDSFVEQARAKFESGHVSMDTWRLVRRGGEIIKNLHDNGTIDLPPCSKWEVLHNSLHREPTTGELANPNSVVSLVRRTEQRLAELGLMPKTLSNYRYDGFDRILRRHYELGLADYSPDLAATVAEEARAAYESGTMSRSIYQDVRKTADILTKNHESGTYDPKYLQRYGLRQLSDTYDALLESFCAYARRTVIIKESTVLQAKSSIRGFLFEMEDAGFMSLDEVTRRIISERVTHLAGRFSGGLNSMLFGVRMFLHYLYSNGFTGDDLSIAIPELIAPRKRVHEGFSPEVIDKLLAAADTSTAIGKRDYAIMLLGKQTGLRACDVTNLKRENIDWRQHEIRIVQVKTEVPLTLHLPVESGNAIVDYLLNARPKNNSPHIFLSKDHPHRPLRSVGTIMPRYIKRVGVADEVPKRSGFHSFRRSYGKQLLEAETTLDMLSELLGQLNMDSAKPYIATDEQWLKRCALGLVDGVKAGDIS
jgi:site-specific recombinase XerD